jgi:hypothetical protein
MITTTATRIDNEVETDFPRGRYDHERQQFICDGGYPSHLEADPNKGLIVTMSTNPLAKDIGR